MNTLKEAKKIISENCYLSLAVSNEKKNWIATLYYSFDKERFYFYFVSKMSSKHSRMVAKNHYVSATIFNSQGIPPHTNGLQMDALCDEVKLKDIPIALNIIYKNKADLKSKLVTSRFKNPLNPLEYTKLTNFRIYKLTPLHAYIINTKILKDDVRVEVEF